MKLIMKCFNFCLPLNLPLNQGFEDIQQKTVN